MPPTKNLELYIRQTNPENYRLVIFIRFAVDPCKLKNNIIY